MAGEHNSVVWKSEQAFFDRVEQQRRRASGKIGAAYAALKKTVAGKRRSFHQKSNMAGGMAGRVKHLDGCFAQPEGLDCTPYTGQ